MPELNEVRGAGFHMISEANGNISRESIIIEAGQNLKVGAVLGKITASGKYVEMDPAAVDGSEVAAGILFDAVDATAADADGVAHVRHAEVLDAELQYITGISAPNKATAQAELLALQIKTL